MSKHHRREPRKGCFEKPNSPNDRYIITDIGIAHVQELASLGAQPREIAQYLRVSNEWMRKALDPENEDFNQDVADAFDEGSSEFKRRLLGHQAALAETNAQMAIHLGKHHLNQKDDATEINHNIRVVGTLPDYGSSSDDWKRQFAPSALQKVEPPRPAKSAQVVDVEIVEE